MKKKNIKSIMFLVVMIAILILFASIFHNIKTQKLLTYKLKNGKIYTVTINCTKCVIP